MKLFFSYFFSVMFALPFFCMAQQSKIDSLKSIIASGNQDLETAKAMNFISYEYVRTDVEKAKQYLWKAKYLGKKLKNDRLLSSTFSQLASINQNQGQIDSALAYLNHLKLLADNSYGEDSNIIKINYHSTAGLFYKKSGNIKEALPNFIKAYDISDEIGEIVSASGQAINIGNSYLGLSDFNTALTYYLKALKGFEQANNKKGQSYCYQNIGECYIELSQFDSAIQYIKKSINLKKEMQDKRGLGNAEQSLGRIYMGSKDYDKSFEHYSKALSICRELKLSTEEVKINFNLGKIFNLKKDPNKALVHYEKSRELAKKLGDSTYVIAANLEILALKETEFKEETTEKNAIENIQLLKQTGAISKEAAGYKNMADYYINLQQFDKALEYTKRYHSLTDSIKNNQILAQFKSIEEQYNKATNEKQIELLQKDQVINEEKLKQQRFLILLFGSIILFISLGIWMLINRHKLRQKLHDIELRNQIAADLHDEVGSSLSSIYMLSQMAGKANFKNKQDILNKVSNNAHETMDKMSDIVWMLKPSDSYSEALEERMELFVNELCNSRNIAFSFSATDLDTVKLSMSQNKNLYLIFKEAVNNAVKYSDTKTLHIKINSDKNYLEMIIKDEGIGFEEESVEKGNGLDNMRHRAEELKGELTIDSKPKKGTQVTLKFPISKQNISPKLGIS